MNKYQSIALIVGFVLISLTYVWGSSQFGLSENVFRSSGSSMMMTEYKTRIKSEKLEIAMGIEVFLLVILIVILENKFLSKISKL